MQSKLKFYSIAGFLFSSTLGTLMHFFYEWSGNNKLVALFCPVSESVWEHLKLILFPILFYSIFEAIVFRKETNSLATSNLIGMFLALILTPVLYYSYTGIIGTNYMVVDIAIFFISVAVAYIFSYDMTLSREYVLSTRFIIYIITIIVMLLFFVFTTKIPPLNIFAKP